MHTALTHHAHCTHTYYLLPTTYYLLPLPAGHAPWMERPLSLTIWVPIARLSYVAYLVQVQSINRRLLIVQTINRLSYVAYLVQV
jgi:hypothetical protein